jgi:ATP-independent RNA helicase DbpA
LEDGFAEELKAILEILPDQRQTLFFSATFPETIEELSQRHQKNAERITVLETKSESSLVEEYLYEAEKPQKLQTLLQILERYPSKCSLVFCRTKATVDEIGKRLAELKISSLKLHSDLPQAERDRATKLFRNGGLQVLVATDVAARGLDIKSLELVINVDLPSSPEIYVHRIGRTGRAGRKGTAVSICTAYEESLVFEIERFTGRKMLRRLVEPSQSSFKVEVYFSNSALKQISYLPFSLRLHYILGSK